MKLNNVEKDKKVMKFSGDLNISYTRDVNHFLNKTIKELRNEVDKEIGKVENYFNISLDDYKCVSVSWHMEEEKVWVAVFKKVAE